jgi:hypothetical protein
MVSVSTQTVINWCGRDVDPLPHKREGKVIRICVEDFWIWWHRDYKVRRPQAERLYTLRKEVG